MSIFTQNAEIFLNGMAETMYMTVVSTLFAYLFGLPLGVLMIVTDKNGIAPCPKLHGILGWVINMGRSFPFLILMIALFPLTRLIVGKSIGATAAIVPLVIGSAPFVARLVESSLKEVDSGVVEAARTMGATNWQIVTKVLLPEAVPSIVQGISITAITLVGYSAMGGVVGAGGLGDIAIRYGLHRYENDIMLITIILLIVLVQCIQTVFNALAKRLDKKCYR